MSERLRLCDLTPSERLRGIESILQRGGADAVEALRPLQRLIEWPPVQGAIGGVSQLSATLHHLNSFDAAIDKLTGYRGHIYLLGDDQVRLLTLIADPCSPHPHPSALEVLSTCGLIYRFNAARKFAYAERSVMQLRINSWGRHHCEMVEGATEARPSTFMENMIQVLDPFASAYRRIIDLCASAKRPLDTTAIHELNDAVPIRIVT